MDLELKTNASNLQFDMNRRCGGVPVHQGEEQHGHSCGSGKNTRCLGDEEAKPGWMHNGVQFAQ